MHHAFTAANALHQALVRNADARARCAACVQGALRVYLDRFLNVPAARLPTATHGDLAELGACWNVQGEVDAPGAIVVGYLRGGGDRGRVIAALGHALLAEDPGFHWYQVVRGRCAPGARVAGGIGGDGARSCAASRGSSPRTRRHGRELPTVVRIADRLRRGEAALRGERRRVTPPRTAREAKRLAGTARNQPVSRRA